MNNIFKQKLTFQDYLTIYESEIYTKAAKCGINWNTVKHKFKIGESLNKGIAFNKKDEGKVSVYVHEKHLLDGTSFPLINFCDFRKSYPETWIPNISGELITPDNINLFKEIEQSKEIITPVNHSIWNNASKISEETKYRGLNLTDIHVRRGKHYKHGNCFIFPIFNSEWKIIGYQLVYDEYIEEIDGNKQFIGKYKDGFILLGDEENLKNGLIGTESIANGLRLFYAPKLAKKSIFNNAKNKAVVIFLSSNNIENVIAQFIGMTPSITIAADNDLSDNGNHGIYCALKAARKYGCEVIYPVKGNEKCDFYDTLEFRKLKVDKTKTEILIQDILYDKDINLEKATSQLIDYLSFKIPNKYSIRTTAKLVKDLLKTRNYVYPECIQTQFEMNLMFYRKQLLNATEYIIKNEILHDCNGLTQDELFINIIKQIIHAFETNAQISLVLPWSMGSGKTEMISKIVKHFSDKQHLYISPRKALVNDVCSKANLVSYLSDTLQDEDSMAYCLNSIIYTNVEKYDFLYSDEIVSSLNHLLMGSINNRTDVFNTFTKAMSKIPVLLFADADFNQNALDFINTYSNDREVHIFKLDSNIVKPKVIGVPNIKVCYSKLKEAFNNNENCMVAVSTIEEGKNVVDALLELCIDPLEIKFIHSDTEDNNQVFFDNINEESKKFRFLVYTTKMGTGVSITNNHFKYNYLISSGLLPTNDCLQMLGRNRCAKEWIICASTGQTNRYDIKRSECEVVNNQYQYYTIEQEDCILKRTELGMLIKDKIIEVNKDTNNSSRNIFLTLMNKGFEIEYDEETQETKVTSHKTERVDATIKLIDESKIITDEEEEHIIKNGKVGKYKHEIDKKRMLRLTGKETIDENDIRLLLSNSRCKQIEMFNIVNLPSKDNNEWDLMNQVTLEQRYSKSIIQECFNRIVTPYLDKVIDKETAEQMCKLVKTNHHDLGENGFPNYNKEFLLPIRGISKFISHFGYELIKVIDDSIINEQDTYKIQPNSYIQECFNRRT